MKKSILKLANEIDVKNLGNSEYLLTHGEDTFKYIGDNSNLKKEDVISGSIEDAFLYIAIDHDNVHRWMIELNTDYDNAKYNLNVCRDACDFYSTFLEEDDIIAIVDDEW